MKLKERIKAKISKNNKKVYIKELRPDMTECRLILVEKRKNEKKS